MLARPYEMPWRRAYEGYAGATWYLAFAAILFDAAKHDTPRMLATPMALLCLVAWIRRTAQALRILVVRASLSGGAVQVIGSRQIERLTTDPHQVYFGQGFEWLPVHSQRLYELAKVDYRDHLVSPAVSRLLGYQSDPQPDAEIGLPYIHGVEPLEQAMYRPLQNFEGGLLLVGTTQAGKGVALATLVTQRFRLGCGERRRPGSGRSGGAPQPAQADALHRERDRADSGGQPTSPRCRDPGAAVARGPGHAKAAARRGDARRPAESTNHELRGLVSYYERHVPDAQRNKTIDAQVRTFRHDREHYRKITASLLPILSMLTSGDLGRTLSPDPFDIDDTRPIMNLEEIEQVGHVLYMCVDSLPDPSVASAIGALALADLAARAGMRYNLGAYPAHRAVRGRSLQRHQPAADRDPEQGR